MADVAKLAGVSRSTVSRVLNETNTSIPISDKTRDRILDAVRELGYQPNMLAQGLRSQKTNMIAVMTGDISNGFYHPIVRAIQDEAARHGYDVLIASTDHEYDAEKRFCNVVLRRYVDGAVLIPFQLTDADIDDLVQQNIPLVVLAGHINHPRVDQITEDDARAIVDAVTWLHDERGHRHIGYIGAGTALPIGQRRQAAYETAIRQRNLPTDPTLITNGYFKIEGGSQAIQELLALPEPPTAVFAANDLMAIGALLQAQAMGYRVPEDIAIVGYDDQPEASLVRPRLTTIAQNARKLGEQLARLLFDRINGYDGEPRLVRVQRELVIRESA